MNEKTQTNNMNNKEPDTPSKLKKEEEYREIYEVIRERYPDIKKTEVILFIEEHGKKENKGSDLNIRDLETSIRYKDNDDMEAKDMNEEDEKNINKDKTSSSTPSSSNSENQTSIDESEIQVEQKDEFDKKTETQLDYLRDTKGISIADIKELKEQIQNQFFKLSKLKLEDDEPLLWIMVWWKRYLREEIRLETNHLKDFLTEIDQRLLKVREFINKLDKIKQNQLTEMVSLFEHKKINLDEITEALLNELSTNGLQYYEKQNKGVMQYIEKKLKMSSLINLSIGAVNIVFLLLIASKFL